MLSNTNDKLSLIKFLKLNIAITLIATVEIWMQKINVWYCIDNKIVNDEFNVDFYSTRRPGA